MTNLALFQIQTYLQCIARCFAWIFPVVDSRTETTFLYALQITHRASSRNRIYKKFGQHDKVFFLGMEICNARLRLLRVRTFCTGYSLGYFEKEDLKIVIQYLRSTGYIGSIGLWGRSMGAVTALLHADRDHSLACLVLYFLL